MPWTTVVVMSIIIFLGALLQGSVGFGMGLFAVPFLLLLDRALVPGPILLASGALTILMVVREHHAVRRRDLIWSLSGRVVGTLVALAVLRLLSPARFEAAFGILILFAVGLTALGVPVSLTPGHLTGAGMLSGFMGTTVSIGGPPMALLYQRETGPNIRATLSAFFLVGTVLSLTGLHLVHLFGAHELLLGLALLPGTWLGFLASRWTAGHLDRGYMRHAILAVSALTGAVVVVKGLFR